MNCPRVSIIIPVYNTGERLAGCIESALGQSEKNVEIIAVDDGSSDGSWGILKSFAAKDPRLKIFRNDKNLGQAAARNRAISQSTGQWLAFLDSDDELAPDFCKVLLEAAERSGADIVKGRAKIIKPDGKIRETPLEMQRNITEKSPLCFNETWWTAIYRADKIRCKITLDENASVCEDLIFLVEVITLPAKVFCVDEIVYIQKRRVVSAAERSNRSLDKIASCLNAGVTILQTLNEKGIYNTDPYGYRVWARETLRWLGGFHRSRPEDREKALELCLSRAPAIASLIKCDFSGWKKIFMPAALKILKDDRWLLARKFGFSCYGEAKKLQKSLGSQ